MDGTEEIFFAPLFPQRPATPATAMRMQGLREGRSATEMGENGAEMHL